MSLCDDSTENDHENYEAPTANIVTLINTLMDYLTVQPVQCPAPPLLHFTLLLVGAIQLRVKRKYKNS